jgi:hypothetical protein
MTHDDDTRRDSSTSAIIAEIDAAMSPVRVALRELARRAVTLRLIGPFGADALDEMALEFEPHCLKTLREDASIDGMGLVWEVPERGSGMLWWRSEAGRIARKHHVFNPESDSFYDFRKSQWFRAGLEADDLAVVGPYIDAWGTDDHAVTASLRIMANGECIGVAAADLNVEAVTTRLTRAMRPRQGLVLLDPEDRVVAANAALLSPGLRIAPFLERTGMRVVERHATPVDGWFLARIA